MRLAAEVADGIPLDGSEGQRSNPRRDGGGQGDSAHLQRELPHDAGATAVGVAAFAAIGAGLAHDTGVRPSADRMVEPSISADEAAARLRQALAKGFTSRDLVMKDPDLYNLRISPAFNSLLNEFGNAP